MKTPQPIDDRERAVWLRICEGKSTADIASALKWPKRRVEFVKASLYRKLGLRPFDVAGLVRAAAAADLLKELPPVVRQ